MAGVGILTLLLVAAEADVLRQAETGFHEGQRLEGAAARAAFARSAALYEQLREDGIHNPALYRDQGNAYLLADDLPRAILAYRRGLHLRPDDSALHEAIGYAREQVVYAEPGRFGRPPIQQRPPWLPRLTTPLGLGAALIGYIFGWGAVSVWMMRRQGGLLVAAGGAFVAVALLAVGFVLEAYADRDEAQRPLVVVAEDGVQLYKGNGTSYPHYDAPLNRGVEARLRFDRGAWVQIELASGEIGWVRRTDVLIDTPPSHQPEAPARVALAGASGW